MNIPNEMIDAVAAKMRGLLSGDMPTIVATELLEAAFAAMPKQEPVGVLCTGCGSSWDSERLEKERAANPKLLNETEIDFVLIALSGAKITECGE